MQPILLNCNDCHSAGRIVREWASLVSILSRSFECRKDSEGMFYSCSVSVPEANKIEVSAGNVESATIQLMSALDLNLREARRSGRWAPEYQKLLEETSSPAAEAFMQNEIHSLASTPTRSKERQETIGVTTQESLRNSVTALAELRGDSLAIVARELVADGFDEFETRSYSESPRKLLGSYENSLGRFECGQTVQWMIRLERHLSIRIKLTAKEYGRSASQIVAIFMAEALAKRQVAASEAADATELVLARAALKKVKGPAVRVLAEQIGLGTHSMLLSGILAGKIEAPHFILSSLSANLEISLPALTGAIGECFDFCAVPSFKAGSEKPTVSLVPQTWEDAVNSLQLSTVETDRLLAFKYRSPQ